MRLLNLIKKKFIKIKTIKLIASDVHILIERITDKNNNERF